VGIEEGTWEGDSDGYEVGVMGCMLGCSLCGKEGAYRRGTRVKVNEKKNSSISGLVVLTQNSRKSQQTPQN
jgi:hypothetical protein